MKTIDICWIICSILFLIWLFVTYILGIVIIWEHSEYILKTLLSFALATIFFFIIANICKSISDNILDSNNK